MKTTAGLAGVLLSTATERGGGIAKHLVVDISSHGLGHVAQASLVVNALAPHVRSDRLRITVRSSAPLSTLRERIDPPFDVVPYRQDRGMIMRDALRVDVDRSMEWYVAFHSTYSDRVSRAASDLEALSPDLVFSDVPYLGLDAAATVGVPSVALCSLNWADIFMSYCGDRDGSRKIWSDINGAYSKASVFLRPTPSMEMPDLSNAREVPPLALVGEGRTGEMLRLSDRGEGTRFALIGVGGYGVDRLPLDSWPASDGVCWIFPDSVLSQCPPEARRDDFLPQSAFDGHMRYIDLLSSCDLVVTKTGYGTQTEAAVNRVPAICINRNDWPEHPFLSSWHQDHGEVAFIDWENMGTPIFGELVESMLQTRTWSKDSFVPNGAKVAADIVLKELGIET